MTPTDPKDIPATAKEVTRTVATASRETLNSVASGFSGLFDFNAKLLDACTEASRAYTKQLTALNEEVTTFANRRLQEQSQLRDLMSHAKDWGDLMRLQQDWVQQSTKAYLDESERVFSLLGQATFAGLNPLMESLESLPRALQGTRKAA